jgi:hypothetical protein
MKTLSEDGYKQPGSESAPKRRHCQRSVCYHTVVEPTLKGQADAFEDERREETAASVQIQPFSPTKE